MVAIAEFKSPALTDSEIRLRENFVHEYLQDFNEYRAVIRLGFTAVTAARKADEFMSDSYVLRRLEDLKHEGALTEEAYRERNRQLVLSTLREVMQTGSPASRVNAAARLAAILGLDAPIKIDQLNREAKKGLDHFYGNSESGT